MLGMIAVGLQGDILVAPFIDCIICSLLRTVCMQLEQVTYSSQVSSHLYPQRDGLQLCAHLVELLNVPASH